MYEVACPACTQSTRVSKDDLIHICRHCHTAFSISLEQGTKNIIQDHFYIESSFSLPNLKDSFQTFLQKQLKPLFKKKLKVDIKKQELTYLPFWIIKLEVQTEWEGLAQKAQEHLGQKEAFGSHYVKESGEFIKSYSWAILARRNIKEVWGTDQLNQSRSEQVPIRWTGCELEHLFQTPQNWYLIRPPNSKNYLKYEKALEEQTYISPGQISERKALKLAKSQVITYHQEIAHLKTDQLTSCDTTLDITGILLLHVPFVSFYFQTSETFPKPDQYLGHAYQKALISPVTSSVLSIEWPQSVYQRLWLNRLIILSGSLLFLLISLFFTPFAFPMVAFLLLFGFFSEWKILKNLRQIQEPTKFNWIDSQENPTQDQTASIDEESPA